MSDTVFPTPWAKGHGLGRMVYNLGRELVRRGHAVTLLGLDGSALEGATAVTTKDRTPQGETGWRAGSGRTRRADAASTQPHARRQRTSGTPGLA